MRKPPICLYCGERHRITEKGEYIECYRAHRRDYYHNVLKGRIPPPPAPDGYKRCSKCKHIKPLNSFYRSKNKHDGRESWCKDCSYFHKKPVKDKRTKAYKIMRAKRNAYMRAWRAANREHANEYQRVYHRKRRLEQVLKRRHVIDWGQ